ncbi:MAG: hypothetical protein KKA73_23985 [Chloroflexi bacterium]|nr:hypothetical protein [Chloroflexota bacterium]MBU1750752.1 hypothetical protein [Chloroflexota bacterium]MBU1877422.1 hypothetical protein [Chloroflexota bacterium]
MDLIGTVVLIILVILGVLALIVLVLLALLLFAPFRVAGRGERWPDQRVTGHMLLHWLWRLVGFELIVDSTGQTFVLWLWRWAVWRKTEERGPELEPWERIAEGLEDLVKEIAEEEEEKEGDGLGWPLTWRETLAQRGILISIPREVLRAAIRILTGLRWERLRLRGRIGLGDPAATGILYGMYEAARYSWRWQPVDMRLVPEFMEPALWGEIEGAVRIWVWRIIWPVVQLAFSRPIWRLVWALIRGSWRKWRRGRRDKRKRRPAQRQQRETATAGS